jgi:tetratricopeptide (TPR) repeat protein
VVEQNNGSNRHAAFGELLGSMTEANPDWPAVHAGLEVMRLLDAWLADASVESLATRRLIHAARAAIESVPPTNPAQRILRGIVDSTHQAAGTDARRIAPRVMAYGRSLEYEARWSLAADVYRTIAASLDLGGPDVDIAIDAHLRLGYSLRMQGDMDASEASYARARQIATQVGDTAKVLHAGVGDAALAAARGNLPRAESVLDDIIAAATRLELSDLRAIALHDRATVAHWRGQYDQAVRLAYQALRLTHSLTARDRILNDLAAGFTQLGVLEAARDAFLVLAATAQEQYVRWLAMVNLLEVAAQQTNEPLFEQCRRDLAGEALPPALEAQYHYHVALGYHALGNSTMATRSIARANTLAETHRCNHLLFQIEELRAAIARGAVAAQRTAHETPTDLRDVAEAVSEMRQLAGV